MDATRKQLMRNINMNESELNQNRPSTSGSVKELFNDDGDSEKVNKKNSNTATYDAQKDIMHYVQIHEWLTNYFSTVMLPKFKAEKAENYRKILKQFSILEIENSVNYSKMWQNVMRYHNKRADQTIIEV